MASPSFKQNKELRDEITNRGGGMDHLKRHIAPRYKKGEWLVRVENKQGVFPVQDNGSVKEFDGLYGEVEEQVVADLLREVDDFLDYVNEAFDLEYGSEEVDALHNATLLLDTLRDVCQKHEHKTHSVRRLKPDAYDTLLNYLEEESHPMFSP